MDKIILNWNEFKSKVSSQHLPTRYEEDEDNYVIFAIDNPWEYICKIAKRSKAGQDFENNYKGQCGQFANQRDVRGRVVVKNESRPLDCLVLFQEGFDDVDTYNSYVNAATPVPIPLNTPIIGEGKHWSWDFSNDDDIVTEDLYGNALRAGRKAKAIKGNFIDDVWIKEGALYFFNAPKGCEFSIGVMCPPGVPYPNNDAISNNWSYEEHPECYKVNNTGKYLMTSHYMIKHRIQGDTPMGDEFNTEACQDNALPTYYQLWFYIETDTSDEVSNGVGQLEIYRQRSVILP